MHKYKFTASRSSGVVDGLIRDDGASLGLSNDNRDCVIFLNEWRDGALVQNPDNTKALYSEEAVVALGLTPIPAPPPPVPKKKRF